MNTEHDTEGNESETPISRPSDICSAFGAMLVLVAEG